MCPAGRPVAYGIGTLTEIITSFIDSILQRNSKLHQRRNIVHQQTLKRYDNSAGSHACDDGCYIAVF